MHPILTSASRLAAVWAFGYGLYRWYYALGGTFGMLGTPVSPDQFRQINAIAGVLLFSAAILPLVLLPAWRRARARPILLGVCWIVAVLCVSHALIGITQRIASLTSALTIPYPFWQTIDRRQADLQDLFFNEPWFLTEGLLWATIAWAGALRNSARRQRWVASAVGATAVVTSLALPKRFRSYSQVDRWRSSSNS
jgi:hypothetical protein